jgi:hypothetical protein
MATKRSPTREPERMRKEEAGRLVGAQEPVGEEQHRQSERGDGDELEEAALGMVASSPGSSQWPPHYGQSSTVTLRFALK